MFLLSCAREPNKQTFLGLLHDSDFEVNERFVKRLSEKLSVFQHGNLMTLQGEAKERLGWHRESIKSAPDERLRRMAENYAKQTEVELRTIEAILAYRKVKEMTGDAFHPRVPLLSVDQRTSRPVDCRNRRRSCSNRRTKRNAPWKRRSVVKGQ